MKRTKIERHYYAANNSYGSDSSVGFANTWDVLVFDSKQSRDAYVEDGNLSTRAIRRDEAIGYAANWHMTQNRLIAPKPFTAEFWGIVDHYESDSNAPDGYVGHIEVCDGYEGFSMYPLIERFYK